MAHSGGRDRAPGTMISRSLLYTLAALALWTSWCALMARWPLFATPELRALARVGAVLLPAALFYRRHRRDQPLVDYFRLRERWPRGVLIGAGCAALYFSVAVLVAPAARQAALHIPTDFAAWFNFILGSPLAEELLFRGVLLRELSERLGLALATLASACAFTLLHVPQWTILEHQDGLELLTSSCAIFVYGLLFAVLVSATRSLWASIVPHWINNFILLAAR